MIYDLNPAYLMRCTKTVRAGLCLVTAFLLAIISLFAQEDTVKFLSLEEAIALGLKNNYSIVIAKNEEMAAANNNTPGNAGFLPVLDINAGTNNSISNTRQQFFDGRIQEANNAQSSSLNANALLNWTFFDGTRMFILKNKLEELEISGALQTRITIENTIADIITSYYNIVQLEKFTGVIIDAIRLSEERKKIAEVKFQLGASSELALLQTKVDMNADSSNLLRQKANVIRAKADLNELLARIPEIDFRVDTSISFSGSLQYSELISLLEKENPDLSSLRIRVNIAAQEVKEAKAAYQPKAGVFASYNLSGSDNEVGILRSNRTSGPSFGLTASFNLFNGFNTRRSVQNAKLQLLSAQTELEAGVNTLHSQLYKTYNDYASHVQLVKLENENLVVAKKNVEVSLERYKLGSLTDIELRESQLKLMDAESRLLTSQFAAKAAEVELFRLTGKLK